MYVRPCLAILTSTIRVFSQSEWIRTQITQEQKTVWPGQWSNSASHDLDNEQRLLMLTLPMIMLLILLLPILLLLQNYF